jgi:dynein heavy chain
MEPFVLEIDKAFMSVSPSTPVVFILNQPSLDINAMLSRFAFAQGMRDRLHIIALGHPTSCREAEKALQLAMTEGHWVLLQNCHLAADWLATYLETAISPSSSSSSSTSHQQHSQDHHAPPRDHHQLHSEFRLWLTTESIANFPLSILQRGIKLSTESPTSIKGSMVTLYHCSDDQVFATTCKKPTQFKKLVFALNFFHSILWTR